MTIDPDALVLWIGLMLFVILVLPWINPEHWR